MSSFKRLIAILTATQFLCLALSFWIQNVVEIASHSGGMAIMHDYVWYAFQFLIIAWMTGIQFGVNWMVLSRFLKPVDSRLQQQHEDSLMAVNELVRTRDAIIFGLAKLAESRDPDTGQHLERISLYSVRLASALRKHEKFRDQVNSEFVRMIGISSVLHDIGKVGIEDAILLKPAGLTDAERSKIKQHVELGAECIHQIERRLGNSDFLAMARDIALYHHEHWNGEGYPHGIKEADIPLSARIVAIADVYDALASKRIYKEAMPHIDCVREIGLNAGKQFDPDLVDVFLSIHEQFEDISVRFSDEFDEPSIENKSIPFDEFQRVTGTDH